MNDAYMWRDIQNNMWVGELNINDPWVAANLPFRWKVANKKATRKEIFAEWIAIRHNGLGFRVDEKYFLNQSLLYVPRKYLQSAKIGI